MRSSRDAAASQQAVATTMEAVGYERESRLTGNTPGPKQPLQEQDAPTYETVVFDDGSIYTGTLRGGQPDGLGTCEWKDGNKYDGEWRNGLMHGFGTYLWTSGQRYDGEWKSGKRDGIGVKRYADGSTFDGIWRDGKKHGVGVFRPATQVDRKLMRTASGRLQPQPTIGPSTAALDSSKPDEAVGTGAVTVRVPQGSTDTRPGSVPQTPVAVVDAPGAEITVIVGVQPPVTVEVQPLGAETAGVLSPVMGVAGGVGISRLGQGPGTPPRSPITASPGTTPGKSPPRPAGHGSPLAVGHRASDTPADVPQTPTAGHGPAPGQQWEVAGDSAGVVLPTFPSPQGTPELVRPHEAQPQQGLPVPPRTGIQPPLLTPEPSMRMTDAREMAAMLLEHPQLNNSMGRLTAEKRTASQRRTHAKQQPLDRASEANIYSPDSALTQQLASTKSARYPSAGDGRHAMPAADSVPLGGPQDKKMVFIRVFDDGVLVREDKLSQDVIKSLFKGVWDIKAKKDETRGKRVKRRMKRALGIGKKLQQKAGQLIYKGMPGYDLMIRLQLGIRQSVGRMAHPSTVAAGSHEAAQAGHEGRPSTGSVLQTVPHQNGTPVADAAMQHPSLQRSDFTYKSKVFFPSYGSATTPAHPSSDFKWKDYSPKVFHALRVLWGVQDAEYMLSLAGSQALRQLNSPGKSGCMFFLSDDQKFLVKTMRKSEIHTLVEMLPKYYEHMVANRDSLVPRFYGVYGVKEVHGRTVRFVVMSNIFCTDVQIHRKFDLKGSTYSRSAGPMDPQDNRTVFKDLDLNVALQLPKPLHDRLLKQLEADSAFLEQVGVMDYSLLLGIHFCARARTPMGPSTGSVAASAAPVLPQASTILPGAALGSIIGTVPSLIAMQGNSATALQGNSATNLLSYSRQNAGTPPPAVSAPGSGAQSPVPLPVTVIGTGSSAASPAVLALRGAAAPATGSGQTVLDTSQLMLGYGSMTSMQDAELQQPVSGASLARTLTPLGLSPLGEEVKSPRVPLSPFQAAPPFEIRVPDDAAPPAQVATTPVLAATPAPQPWQEGQPVPPLSGQATLPDALQGVGHAAGAGGALQEGKSVPVNFDLFSNREELAQQLAKVEARMRERNFSEQQMQDVLGLAQLKLLGEKLKHRRRGKKNAHNRWVEAARTRQQELANDQPRTSTPEEHGAAAGLQPVLIPVSTLNQPLERGSSTEAGLRKVGSGTIFQPPSNQQQPDTTQQQPGAVGLAPANEGGVTQNGAGVASGIAVPTSAGADSNQGPANSPFLGSSPPSIGRVSPFRTAAAGFNVPPGVKVHALSAANLQAHRDQVGPPNAMHHRFGAVVPTMPALSALGLGDTDGYSSSSSEGEGMGASPRAPGRSTLGREYKPLHAASPSYPPAADLEHMPLGANMPCMAVHKQAVNLRQPSVSSRTHSRTGRIFSLPCFRPEHGIGSGHDMRQAEHLWLSENLHAEQIHKKDAAHSMALSSPGPDAATHSPLSAIADKQGVIVTGTNGSTTPKTDSSTIPAATGASKLELVQVASPAQNGTAGHWAGGGAVAGGAGQDTSKAGVEAGEGGGAGPWHLRGDAEVGAEEAWVSLGIIDILQDWNVRKRLERGFKATVHDSYAISVAPPGLYAHRFLDFMRREVFPHPLSDPTGNMAAWHTTYYVDALPNTQGSFRTAGPYPGDAWQKPVHSQQGTIREESDGADADLDDA